MKKLKYFLNNFEFIIAAICSILIVLIMFVQILSRYIFNSPVVFAEELVVILFIMSIYLGAIGATRRKQHLQIELISNRFGPKGQKVFETLSDLAFIVAGIFIIYGTYKVAMNLQAYRMTTAILGIPKWICYLIIPFSFVMILFRIIEKYVRRAFGASGQSKGE